MRVLMLGWEFPPFIAGGLGTACHGLTRALSRAGHDITFVLPKATGGAEAEHVRLMGADGVRAALGTPPEEAAEPGSAEDPAAPEVITEETRTGSTRFVELPAGFVSSYAGGGAVGASAESVELASYIQRLAGAARLSASGVTASSADMLRDAILCAEALAKENSQYGRDLFGDADRYAHMVAAFARRLAFDVVHAHDWLAYPAGLAVKAATGRPMVAHIHATEFDRSGENISQAVYDVERLGMHGADRVVAVSRLTAEIVVGRYGVDPERVDVVYNGVESTAQPEAGVRISSDDKIVLFLGRITMQKGPEYFVRSAKRVLDKMANVKFVVAGSGDMAVRMIEEAAALGIGHKVLFTGFLRGRDIDRIFRMADCYVMPSVSEPFGIAALEAIQRDVPVIISKQSGVSEVLTHALKVDFWDTDEMANKILAVLRHPPLSQTLREHGAFEVRRLTWDDAAHKVVETYAASMGLTG